MKKLLNVLITALLVFSVSVYALPTGRIPVLSGGGGGVSILSSGSDADSTEVDTDSGLELVGGKLTIIRGCSDNEILKWDETQDDWNCESDSTAAGGSAIIFDIGDDGGNDSTDVSEIATTGDTNTIFTEPSADKILIAVGNNWPTADTANTGDTATAFFSAGTIEHEYGGLEADVSAYDGLIGITGGATYNQTGTNAQIIIFDGAGAPTSAAMSGDGTMSNAGVLAIGANKILESMLKSVDAPTDEECLTYEVTTGDFEWQACGGAETNSLESTITGILDTEIFIGSGADTGTYKVVSGAITMSNAGVTSFNTTVTVAEGGTGATTLTDGGVLLGSGTGAVTAMSVLADGSIVVGDGTTDPVALAAYSSSTGTLVAARFPALTGDITTSAGSLATAIGANKVTSAMILTIVDSIVWNAAGIVADGTQCADAAKVTINSGPVLYSIICTDNDASSMTGHVTMPDSWDGGTVTFELTYIQTAADTNVMNADVSAQCHGDGETVNSTWGTEIALDDAAVTGSNKNDQITSAAVTPAGTCAAGDELYWRIQLDATETTTAVATLNFTSVKLEYLSNVGD